MKEQNSPVLNNLDRLISILKKLREYNFRHNKDHSFEINFNDFDLLLEGYDKLKREVPEDVIRRMTEPFNEVLYEILIQLKDEVDKLETGHFEIDENIKEIDFLLKSPEISDSEINRLLDKRNTLNKRKIRK